MNKKLSFLIILCILLSTSFSQIFYAPNAYYQKSEENFHITVIQFPNPNIEIFTALGQDQILGKEKLSSIAKRYNADLAINANFFSLDSGEPIGLVVSNGELIHLPIKRGVFAITYDGRAVIDIFETTIKVKVNNNIFKIDNLNSPRGGNQAVLYTKKFARQTLIQNNAFAGVNIIIELDNILPFHGNIKGKVVNIEYGVLSSNIPDNGCVISLGGTALKYLPLFEIGKDIEIIVESKPTIPIKEAICGGPILIKDREIVLGKTNEIPFDQNIINGRHPRTIIATKEDKIIIIFIEGRTATSPGMTLKEAIELLKTLGVENALNLDGGSSSNMVLWKEPLINSDREISTALLIKNITETTEPKYLFILPDEDLYIQKDEKKKIKLIFQDSNFHKLDISSFTWSISNPIIDFNPQTMEITGLDYGSSELTINIGNLSAKKNITVYTNTFLEDFELDKNWRITGKNIDEMFTNYSITTQNGYEGKNFLSLKYRTLPGDSFLYFEINTVIVEKMTKLSLKVYGDGKRGWLRALFYDSNGKPYVLDITSFKGIDWTNEWRTIEKDLGEIKPLISSWNFPPKYPLKLQSIYLVFLNNNGVEGNIFLDDLKLY